MGAKNPGKIFERHFKENTLKEGVYIHRINDTDLSFIGGNSSFTPKSEADFILYYKTLFLLVSDKETVFFEGCFELFLTFLIKEEVVGYFIFFSVKESLTFSIFNSKD